MRIGVHDQREGDGGGDIAGRAAPGFEAPGLPVDGVGASNPGSGQGAEEEDEGYQVVTRARGKLKARATIPATAVQTPVFRFAHQAEASKKRRAEEQLADSTEGASVKEQIRSLKSLIVQLIDQNEYRQEEIEKQRQEIGGLRREMEEMRKLLQQGSTANTAKATYATVTAAGVQQAQTSSIARSLERGGSTLSQRVRVEDDKCAITINTSRFKGEKADFVLVKAALQRGIDTIATLQGIKIKCLRPLPGERINIVFATEAEAKRAKEQSGWLSVAMPEATVKSEAWYPIKCDMVSKQAVLDPNAEGGRSLRREVCAEFAVDNQSENMDFTAMKASRLSKINPWKKTGSLVIWLKDKIAAEHLLKTGQALFGGGAYGAFCSRYEPSTADKMCFNCNVYGHLQGACRRATRCGKCTGAHQTRDCRSQERPKCAVCAGAHRSADWACKRHSYHRRYLAAQAKEASTQQAAPTNEDIEMGGPAGDL